MKNVKVLGLALFMSIFLNGSLFGMSNNYLNSRTADIIEFSELGEKIDQPVRTYSSGMMARLSFSIAIQVQAEILLIDWSNIVLIIHHLAHIRFSVYEFKKLNKYLYLRHVNFFSISLFFYLNFLYVDQIHVQQTI